MSDGASPIRTKDAFSLMADGDKPHPYNVRFMFADGASPIRTLNEYKPHPYEVSFYV